MAREILVLGFSDPDATFALTRAALAAAAPGAEHLLLPDWADRPANVLLAELSEGADPFHSLICLGCGRGALAALVYGRALGATLIVTIAPGAAAPVEGADGADFDALFGDPDLAVAGQVVRLLAAEDSLKADMALADRLRASGGAVEFGVTELPSMATPWALVQSGRLRAWLDPSAVLPDDPAVAWRTAFAHGFEVDLDGARLDAAGALHLSGCFINRADRPLDLSAARLRIGARVLRRGGGRSDVIEEARSGFARPVLEPGQALPFRIRLADAAQSAGAIELALVCDGQFWFDHLGFPAATVFIGDGSAEADNAPALEDGYDRR